MTGGSWGMAMMAGNARNEEEAWNGFEGFSLVEFTVAMVVMLLLGW
jgi:hypothetical protein